MQSRQVPLVPHVAGAVPGEQKPFALQQPVAHEPEVQRVVHLCAVVSQTSGALQSLSIEHPHLPATHACESPIAVQSTQASPGAPVRPQCLPVGLVTHPVSSTHPLQVLGGVASSAVLPSSVTPPSAALGVDPGPSSGALQPPKTSRIEAASETRERSVDFMGPLFIAS